MAMRYQGLGEKSQDSLFQCSIAHELVLNVFQSIDVTAGEMIWASEHN